MQVIDDCVLIKRCDITIIIGVGFIVPAQAEVELQPTGDIPVILRKYSDLVIPEFGMFPGRRVVGAFGNIQPRTGIVGVVDILRRTAEIFEFAFIDMRKLRTDLDDMIAVPTK